MHLIAQIGSIIALVIFCFALCYLLRTEGGRYMLLYFLVWPAHLLDSHRARKYRAREGSEERPTVPLDFKPAKQNPPRQVRPVSDRLVRQIRAHAREVEALDQEGPRS